MIGRAAARRRAADRSRSPWSADPLSWLAIDLLALGCAAYAAVRSLVMLLLMDPDDSRPLLQVAAAVLPIVAFLLVHVTTRPHRGPLREPVAWAAIAIVIGALALSAYGYAGSPFPADMWSAPASVALMLVALTPFSTGLQLARYGAVSFAVTAFATLALEAEASLGWPVLVTVYLVELQIVLAAVGCIVFVAVVTRLFETWNERPLGNDGDTIDAIDPVGAVGAMDGADGARVPAASDPGAALARRVDGQMSARLAVPLRFVREILDRGAVTPEDRERARALAAALRAELIAEAEDTWLARLVRGRPIEVDDVDRLAERLSLPQRTALRAMLDALLAQPDSGFVAGQVELKAADRGTVAVALRILSTLPEGRRVTFLAPYYVTLQATVDDIRWRNGTTLVVDFEVPLNDLAPRAVVQHSPAPAPARPRAM
ncbi:MULTISPECIES: hypothetical protein [unclassified Microcella]|uniref:hypothetical protein n=1 Tax=unclassified Microcella TaxID=2630066 RepID=UPI0006FE9DBE|nr:MULTISPECIES: hypothetical protein [unclassified Microcella]KQV26409.1 hypothetical protein ASC54_05885 [Yonghaparkia sp. Root332]KRF32805.1 hypothetical protein ASG83_01825 [Yonghaparkia sp. Soil809]